MESELLRLWNLVSEITEQLNQNRLATERLQGRAGQLNEQAGQVAEGAILRRFNTDLSKEVLTSETERISVALVIENQSLLHENKQLSSLLQDYEKTLQTVVEKFRGHCHAAETHQLTLNRHYETLLAQERTEDALSRDATEAEHFSNLKMIIERVLRSMEGKDSLPEEDSEEEAHDRDEELQEDEDNDDDDGDMWQGIGDWTEGRETEIQRLEQENAALRHALGISRAQGRELGLEDVDPAPFSGPPPWNKRSFAYPLAGNGPNSFRDDMSSGNGRPTLGHVGGGGSGEQRRPRLLGRGGGFEADIGPGVSSPERVPSPPNEVRWRNESMAAPVTESI